MFTQTTTLQVWGTKELLVPLSEHKAYFSLSLHTTDMVPNILITSEHTGYLSFWQLLYPKKWAKIMAAEWPKHKLRLFPCANTHTIVFGLHFQCSWLLIDINHWDVTLGRFISNFAVVWLVKQMIIIFTHFEVIEIPPTCTWPCIFQNNFFLFHNIFTSSVHFWCWLYI